MDRLAVFVLRGAPERQVLVLSDPPIADSGTVIAAPLFHVDTFPIATVINPVVEIAGQSLALATEQMAAISVKSLGKQVATCTEHEYAIANAINRLFFGI